MPQLLESILEQFRLASVLDIGITAILIYWLFSLIRGTSAVRLVIGVSVLFAVYFTARVLNLRLLTQILETGAVVGLFALVVIFQPELRRALDRIGRVGSLGWLVSAESRQAELVATEVARAAAVLSAEGHGALMVIERETGLEQMAETGVMIHGDLSADLVRTIFSPRSPLHDGAVIIRGTRILAAGAVLPLAEMTMQSERFGTRHRAALGTTEQTDAIVVVVSEENGQVSIVERARIRRNLSESQLARALTVLLEPTADRARLRLVAVPGARAPRLADLGRAVRRERSDMPEPLPPDEPLRAADDQPASSADQPAPSVDHVTPATEDRVAATDGSMPVVARSDAREAAEVRSAADARGRGRYRGMARLLGFVVHNWPLKVGAIALSTLLYGGLVLSQTTQPFTSPVPIRFENASEDVVVLSNPGFVTRIEYVAPPDLGLRIDATTFAASVDLAGIDPTGAPQTVPVRVEAIDDRIQILGFQPDEITMTVDRRGSKTVPIVPVLLPLPSGLEAGDAAVEAETAVVTGPQSIVETVREVQAPVAIDASGVDVNQLVTLVPIDDLGEALGAATRIEVEPAQVRVRVSVFSDRRSKTLPVSPNVFGTPAAGFEIESVSVSPAVVSVEGDANDLAGLANADTEPVSVAGASSAVVQTVRLALPDGVEALGTGTVEVTVQLRPVTATRTFQAGLVLVGAGPDRQYALSTDRVLVTIGGSLADLDRLSGATLVLNVDVTGLEDGTHSVAVSANLQTGLTLVAASPNPVEVTVTGASPPPSPSPEPSPTP